MRYELKGMRDEDVYSSALSYVNSSLYYHQNKWYSGVSKVIHLEMGVGGRRQ